MKFRKDPRMKIVRKALAFSWVYYTIFVIAVIVLGSSLAIKSYLFGLPRRGS